jgi:hypothetical protein
VELTSAAVKASRESNLYAIDTHFACYVCILLYQRAV